jgi:hypothetical protein
MKRPANYEIRLKELQKELESKTLTEAEVDRGITRLDYTGVGYGYNLKAHPPKNLAQAQKDVKSEIIL